MASFRLFFIILFIYYSVLCFSQYNGLRISYPLERAPVITGNYGEIRPNHFHAGLDFTTSLTENLPIKSISDGYVSRIKISSIGYGKVLYITHPNGIVSVYAHQKKYSSKIDSYVKAQQLILHKNELELFPAPNELIIKEGEIIGYTGNSGSSTGPHLHFEIRDEKSEIPLNPLLFYKIRDDIKPIISHIAIFNTQDTNNISLQTFYEINQHTKKISANNTINLKQNTFAIAFSGYDQANGTANKNNIYEIKILLDNNLIYHHQLNNISFDNGRYVNYFSEKINGHKLQKCFVPSCYTIDIYKKIINGGKIELMDTLKHRIELITTDEQGNSSVVFFYVKTKYLSGYKTTTTNYNSFCNDDLTIKKENTTCFIPKGALTKSTFVAIYTNKLSEVVIGNKNDILLKPFVFSVKINQPLKNKENKIVVANEKNCLTGVFEDGWFTSESKNFGNFKVTYDTIPPVISFPKSKNNSKLKHIQFKVTDNLSGIKDYCIYLNNVWQIAEYDFKSNTINVLTTHPIITGDLKIEITDKVGNTSVLNKHL